MARWNERSELSAEFRVKKEIVDTGRRMYDNGYIAALDGNISVRISGDRILATPTGCCKGELRTEDLVLLDLNGNQVQGSLKPSSEIKMHLVAYNRRRDVNAVVHGHPPFATAFAVSGISLERCVLPEIVTTMGAVPKAPYATPSTTEVPDSVRELVEKSDSMLLQNHGVLCLGSTLKEAYFRMETVEHYAKIYYYALNLGGINYLDQKDVEKLMFVREKLGYPGMNVPCCPGGNGEA